MTRIAYIQEQIIEKICEVRGEQGRLWEAAELVAGAVKDVRSCVESGFAALAVDFQALKSCMKSEVAGLLNDVKAGNLASIQAVAGLQTLLTDIKVHAAIEPSSSSEAADLVRIVSSVMVQCASELQADMREALRADVAAAVGAEAAGGAHKLVLELEKHRALLLHDLEEGRSEDRFLHKYL